MPQTMLALLGLTLSSLIAFNQQRLTLQSHQTMVLEELEIAGAGTANHVVEMIAARSFDEASTPRAIFVAGDIPTQASAFSQSASFGASDRGSAGCDLTNPSLAPDCDDVDDVDGVVWQPVTAELSGGRTLQFEVSLRIAYVTEPGSTEASPNPTRHKRVELDLRSPNFPDREVLLSLTRVISYDPIKAEADFETQCGAIGSGDVTCGS